MDLTLNDLPTEILMKIMDCLNLRDKLTLSTVSHRFLDIFSDFHFAKDLIWHVRGNIHPKIMSVTTYPEINLQRFLNIHVDDCWTVEPNKIQAVDEVTYLQLFSRIGKLTAHLKVNRKERKSLLSYFPVLESIEIDDIKHLTHYDSIPLTLKTINVLNLDALVSPAVIYKLERLPNLTMLKSNFAKIEMSDESKETPYRKLLFRLQDELKGLVNDNGPAFISSSKSLLNATVGPLDLTHLSLTILNFNHDVGSILKKLENLEKFSYRLHASLETICFQIHDVNWPKLRSLFLGYSMTRNSGNCCEQCLNTTKNNFPHLTNVTPKRIIRHTISCRVRSSIRQSPSTLLNGIYFNRN